MQKKTLLECGVENFRPFDVGESAKFGHFEVIATFADHTVPAIGVVVKHKDTVMYFSGDTEYNEKLESLKEHNIDIMFICINGRLGNMNVEEAVRLTAKIDPKVGVPTHYGMFESNTEDPKKYTEAVKCGFEMEYMREYSVSEVIGSV